MVKEGSAWFAMARRDGLRARFCAFSLFSADLFLMLRALVS